METKEMVVGQEGQVILFEEECPECGGTSNSELCDNAKVFGKCNECGYEWIYKRDEDEE